MIELIRNCLHGSEIATYKYYDQEQCTPCNIFKTATTPDGIRNLQREIHGWSWYDKRRKNNAPSCKIIANSKQYCKIAIKYYDGNRLNLYAPISDNYNNLLLIIDHYVETFGTTETECAFHGDLSLDNIIINHNLVTIIDWEHFSAEKTPWGFDLIYLIFESLFFSLRKNQKNLKNDIQNIKRLIRYIKNTGPLSQEMESTPLAFVLKFISENKYRWNPQLIYFPQKLPVTLFKEGDIKKIDAALGQT